MSNGAIPLAAAAAAMDVAIAIAVAPTSSTDGRRVRELLLALLRGDVTLSLSKLLTWPSSTPPAPPLLRALAEPLLVVWIDRPMSRAGAVDGLPFPSLFLLLEWEWTWPYWYEPKASSFLP